MKRCEHCLEVNQTIRIDTPRELIKAIRVVRANLADNTIVPSTFWPTGTIRFSQTPFDALTEDGPWDDVMCYYFKCPECGKHFKLSAETYHGAGGWWKPVDE